MMMDDDDDVYSGGNGDDNSDKKLTKCNILVLKYKHLVCIFLKNNC